MNVTCSVCYNHDGLKLMRSAALPGARYIACEPCRDEGKEPRPLVVLGAIYGDTETAKRLIKERRYAGEDIKASEIL